MIVWVIAGLLALATGFRIGWALVQRRSVVSSAMIVALGALAVLAAFNWRPLTRLIDTGWPNISVGLSQVALVASAAGSCVMITSVAGGDAAATRRLARLQYGVAAAIAAAALGLFLAAGRQPEMSPREFLAHNPGGANALPWLIPLLYVMTALTLATWVGLSVANPTRRGRALFLFTVGTALIAAAAAFLVLGRIASSSAGVGTAVTVLLVAMSVVAASALLPTVEDWWSSRRELTVIQPLLAEMRRRHPDIGIGRRPRGPLAFRVAERLSQISDALYLEAARTTAGAGGMPSDGDTPVPAGVGRAEQASAVARWIADGPQGRFPGREWLRQPAGCSDRDWILEIAARYREC